MANTKKLVKILVCDDDPQDRKLIRSYLNERRSREMVMLEAGQTDEIQRALEKGQVDLVLMDVQMPSKSGMEWLKEIVEKQVAPVVMLTGYGNEELAVNSLQEGAVGYLSKNGLSSTKLLESIDKAMEKWRELMLARANQEELEILVNIDTLTGVYNRRSILQRLDEQIKRARRYLEDLSVIMLDIDHFKYVNDIYGHITGDYVLERISELLRYRIRDADIVGRYGGEEFLIILPQTDLLNASVVAERIRISIKTTRMKDSYGNTFNITVSQGLAKYKPGDEMGSLISRADKALYKAKDNGRDRTEISSLSVFFR